MRPTIDFDGCATDCRSLTLGGSFYNLSPHQVQELMVDFQQFVNILFDETCVLEWTYENRAATDVRRCFKNSEIEQGSLFLRGFVRNQTVYNKTTLRDYCRKRLYSLDPSWAPMDTSIDYLYKKAEFLPSIDWNSKNLKNDIQALFLLDSEYLNDYSMLDLSGHVNVDLSLSKVNMLCGTLCLSISFLCLDDWLDDISEKMCCFAENLSNKYIRISMTIGIETLHHGYSFSDYMRYFGELRYPEFTNIHHDIERTQIDYAQIVYLTRLGWANILSPMAASLKRQFQSTSKPDSDIETKELLSGGLLVRWKKTFSSCKMTGYAQLKAEIYGALYPGGIIFPARELNDPMSTCLRPRWECVPLFNDEIHIGKNSIRIQHCGQFNKEALTEIL